jgi:hypothetical protein
MLAVDVAKQDGLRARRPGMLKRASVPSAVTKHNKPQTVVIQMFLVRVAKNKKKAENIFRKIARECPAVKRFSTANPLRGKKRQHVCNIKKVRAIGREPTKSPT